GIVSDGLDRERDADLEQAAGPFGNALDATDDFRAHEIVHDRRDRHLDALLDRNGAGALLDRTRLAAHEVDDLQTRRHGRLLRTDGSSTTIERVRKNRECFADAPSQLTSARSPARRRAPR